MEKNHRQNTFSPTDILIPASDPQKERESFEKWSVIACDQFSSQPEYWERAGNFAGNAPSTLNMVIPEAYLAKTDENEQASIISRTAEDYLKKGIFRELKDSFIYVERTQPDGRVRKGLVGAVELDDYDFARSDALIRASEGTILDRLPARVNIRRSSKLELPHIIAFVSDKAQTVIEPLEALADGFPVVYDFALMEGGGHIKGRAVTGEAALKISQKLNGLRDKNGILMIIGDGNHSLAAAKVYWDELKQGLSEAERENHPARRALVEVCNVYDGAIDFEAIHRVLFNIDADAFIKAFESAMPKGTDYTVKWTAGEKSGSIGIKASCIGDMLVAVQDFIDSYIKEHPGCTIDYIHGEDETTALAQRERTVGLILPSMDKSEVFETVAIRGVFPRKSFSVGHAKDKRYYLECRKIK